MTPLHTLSIGGATFDLLAHTERTLTTIEIGSKIAVSEVKESCGGGASNTSVGLKRLGCDASFCGVLGCDQWGEKLMDNLKREGVKTDLATQVENETTSFSIIVGTKGGERTIFYTAGTNVHLQDSTFDREAAAQMDWIYLNHLHERSCMIEDDLIALLAIVKGPGLTWNPGGCQIEQGVDYELNRLLMANTKLLLLNKEEALAFSGQLTVADAFKRLASFGPRVVSITDGANGTFAYDGTHFYHCPALRNGEIVDTTGAGDAFGVGMTYGLASGWDLPNCLRAGTINAASVLSFIGAQQGLLTDTEMQRRLTSVRLDVEVLPSLS